jgi:hypothetical protein
LPRTVGIVSIVVGVLAFFAGIVVYGLVRKELSDQKITVSSDAAHFAGKDVKGPFTAYAEAVAISNHALEAGGGKTYAELDQNDPKRATVQTADFLQASLYTSVVAFGVAVLVSFLGVMFALVGFTLLELDKRTLRLATVDVGTGAAGDGDPGDGGGVVPVSPAGPVPEGAVKDVP